MRPVAETDPAGRAGHGCGCAGLLAFFLTGRRLSHLEGGGLVAGYLAFLSYLIVTRA